MPFLILLLLYFRFIFGYFIRNFERQADLYVIKILGSGRALISAFDRIAGTSGESKKKPNWHHFGIGERIDTLERCEGELGDFANAATGTAEQVVLENEYVKLTFSTLGGRPYTVELKQYQTHDSLPVYLFDGDSTIFALHFFATDNLALP